jgi:signal transduction histidine kinase
MNQARIKTLLIVEDNPGDARLLREMLGEEPGHDVEMAFAATMSEAESILAANSFDMILLDLGLPDAQGMTAIRRTRAVAPTVPLVVLTGMDDESIAAQSLQEGAQDYLIKGQVESRSLVRALRYATERKRLEKLKDEFVSTVSHELRTPLTSIAASLGLLMGNASGTLPAPAARLIEIAHNNSQRLVRLVNDILDIEKLEAGRVEFKLMKIDLRSLVERSVVAAGGLAQAHRVQLRITGIGESIAVRADSDRLTQVVTNLLSNAIKYSPPEEEVLVTIDAGPDLIRISMHDFGPGIPVEFRPHIFQRFAQADATDARSKSGTGLGLSIVKEIVSRFGGKVGFSSGAQDGTTFYIELPRWDGTSDRAFVESARADSRTKQDDEESFQGLINAAQRCLPATRILPINSVATGGAA